MYYQHRTQGWRTWRNYDLWLLLRNTNNRVYFRHEICITLFEKRKNRSKLVFLLRDFFSPMTQQLSPNPVGQGLLIFEASLSYSDTPQSAGLLRTSDQPEAETCTWQHILSQETDVRARGGIRSRSPSANERPQTHTVDGAVTGIGLAISLLLLYVLSSHQFYPFLHHMIQVVILMEMLRS